MPPSHLTQSEPAAGAAPPNTPAPSTDPATEETRAQGPLPRTGSFHELAYGFMAAAPSTPLPITLQPGAIIDDYELLELVGRGGMGVVFKARQPKTGQMVAVKMIRDDILDESQDRQRFVREVEALGRVQPVRNIVPIYHVGNQDGLPYYVMPFLSGGNLARRMRTAPTDARQSVALVEKIARAVQQLHERQILHRDIKPGNILLDEAGEPFLADFGLIKLLDRNESLTRTQQRLGTPSYMAPEQTGLLPTPVSPQSDIWALGTILYELLTGTRPFTTTESEESTTLLWKIVNQTPPRPRVLAPQLDAGLEAVILKCLEKKPAERFESAAALADELARWLRQEKLHTRRSPLWGFVRRHRRALVALAVLAIGAALGITLWRRGTPEYRLQALREELRENGAVTLVGPNGPPRWHARAIDTKVDTYIDRGGHWNIETWDLVFIELLRDIPFENFKLHAELRHQKSDPWAGQYNGHVGIFIGHAAQSSARNTPHFLCNLYYNDIITEAPKIPLPIMPPLGNTARLKLRLNVLWNDDDYIDESLGWTKAARFTHVGMKADQWRTLEMELREKTILCRFDGQDMASLDRASAEESFRETLLERQKDYPRYRPLGDCTGFNISHRGSIGIVVSKGSVAVRNVRITKLSSAN